jgi:hypothetical protein
MNIRSAAAGLTLALVSSAVSAGPCTDRIYALDVALSKRLDAAAAEGHPAPQSLGAQLHHQPTPSSVAGAEAQVGDLSPAAAQAITEAMDEARKADDAGDRAGCELALAKAENMLQP